LIVGLALFAGALAHVGTSRRAALFVALTIAGALVLEPVLKEVIQRPPIEGPTVEYSFPSGHALRSMVGAVALTLLLWHTRFRWPIVLGAAAPVTIIGVAIVHHDWHWVSDVLGGWCLGGAWVALLYLIIRPVPGARPGNETVPAVR
jgi:membrane-associated phospholipid phosphatase